MEIRGFESAQSHYDNQEPPDNTTEASRNYQESLTQAEQVDVCREYLDHVGFERFEEWMFDKVLKECPEWLTEYCEKLDSFWEWLE